MTLSYLSHLITVLLDGDLCDWLRQAGELWKPLLRRSCAVEVWDDAPANRHRAALEARLGFGDGRSRERIIWLDYIGVYNYNTTTFSISWMLSGADNNNKKRMMEMWGWFVAAAVRVWVSISIISNNLQDRKRRQKHEKRAEQSKQLARTTSTITSRPTDQ